MKREVTVTLPVKIPPTSGMEAKPISRANIQEPAVSADINKGSDDVKDDEIQDTVEVGIVFKTNHPITTPPCLCLVLHLGSSCCILFTLPT